MAVYEIAGKRPKIGNGSWIAPSAEIIGDVAIGENCYIGFGAVIRGDFGPIRIGNETLVEENVVIHTATQTTIGNRVIIGHMVMIHDAIIMDGVLVGMKSMICENVSIGENSIVAEQSLIRKNTAIPSGKIVAGSPAKVVGNITERHRNQLSSGIQVYLELIKQYDASFVQVDY